MLLLYWRLPLGLVATTGCKNVRCIDRSCIAQSIMNCVDSDIPVFLSFVTSSESELFQNFCCFLEKVQTRASFAIISESMEVLDTASRYNFITIHFSFVHGSEELKFGEVPYRNFILNRSLVVRDLLSSHISVCITDVDSVWLSDPFDYLIDTEFGVTGQMDHVNLCGGLLFLNAQDSRVLSLWQDTVDQYIPLVSQGSRSIETTEQGILNRLLRSKYADIPVKRLPSALFPNGMIFFEQNASQTPIIVHNNYIVGNEEKIQRFQSRGLWEPDCGMTREFS